MNKIQYVRITGCKKESYWYYELYKAKSIVQVYRDRDIETGDYVVVKSTTRSIKQADCEPVKIKELDKDIDGNYLECGDEAEGWDTYTGSIEGPIKGKYLCKHPDNDMGYMIHDKKQDCPMYCTVVRKIPKEEKKEKIKLYLGDYELTSEDIHCVYQSHNIIKICNCKFCKDFRNERDSRISKSKDDRVEKVTKMLTESAFRCIQEQHMEDKKK